MRMLLVGATGVGVGFQVSMAVFLLDRGCEGAEGGLLLLNKSGRISSNFFN